jgi:site-specific DNA-adenine methylase
VRQKRLKCPWPWFGGKSRVAHLIWQRLGDVDNFCEPFFGSGAVLLARPHPPRIETVNDLDCMVANFWRATQHDPEAVAAHADWPVNEVDLHSRHRWLVLSDDARAFRERMRADPDHYDPKIAGWWCWGLCCWIGAGWCQTNAAGDDVGRKSRPRLEGERGPGQGVHKLRADPLGERPHEWQQVPHIDGRGDAAAGPGLKQQRPILSAAFGHDVGTGVHGRPQLADAYSRGRGVHGTDAADRYLADGRRPFLSTGANTGDRGVQVNPERLSTCASRRAWLIDWFSRLRDRLRTVRVCCGHFMRVMDSESVTTRLGVTGIFADPPYPHTNPDGSSSRSEGLYAQDAPDKVRDELLAYCLERGDNPMMRICVAGYDTDGYAALERHGWDVVAWQAQGGYGNRSKKGRANAKRERLYFSPGCVKPDLGLFRDFA